MTLYDAVTSNNIPEIQRILREADNVTQCIAALNDQGLTAMHLAVIHNNIEALNELLSLEKPDSIQDADGSTPIFYAHTTESFRALFFMSDATIKNKHGLTYLTKAVEENRLDIVKLYLNYVPLKVGQHILHRVQTKEMAELLISNGADPREINEEGLSPSQVLVNHGLKDAKRDLITYLNAVVDSLNTPTMEGQPTPSAKVLGESTMTIREVITNHKDDLPRIKLGDSEAAYIITNDALKSLQRLEGNARDTIVRMLHSGEFGVVRAKGAVGLKLITTSDDSTRYELKPKNTDQGKLRVHGILLKDQGVIIFYSTTSKEKDQMRALRKSLSDVKIDRILDLKCVRDIKLELGSDKAIAAPSPTHEEPSSPSTSSHPASRAPSEEDDSGDEKSWTDDRTRPTTSSSSSSNHISLKSLETPKKDPWEHLKTIEKEISKHEAPILILNEQDSKKLRGVLLSTKQSTKIPQFDELLALVRTINTIPDVINSAAASELFAKHFIAAHHSLSTDEVRFLETTLARFERFQGVVPKQLANLRHRQEVVYKEDYLNPHRQLQMGPNTYSRKAQPREVSSPTPNKLHNKQSIKSTHSSIKNDNHQATFLISNSLMFAMKILENRHLIKSTMVQFGLLPSKELLPKNSSFSFITTKEFTSVVHFACGLGLHFAFPQVSKGKKHQLVSKIFIPLISSGGLWFRDSLRESSDLAVAKDISEHLLETVDRLNFTEVMWKCTNHSAKYGILNYFATNPITLLAFFLAVPSSPLTAAMLAISGFADQWVDCYMQYRLNNLINGLENIEYEGNDVAAGVAGLSAASMELYRIYKILKPIKISNIKDLHFFSNQLTLPIQIGLVVMKHFTNAQITLKDLWNLALGHRHDEIFLGKNQIVYDRAFSKKNTELLFALAQRKAVQKDTLKLLKNVDVNAKLISYEEDGTTVRSILYEIVRTGNLEGAEALIKAGVNVNDWNTNIVISSNLIVVECTVLHAAIFLEDFEMVKLLLANGADKQLNIQVQSSKGSPILTYSTKQLALSLSGVTRNLTKIKALFIEESDLVTSNSKDKIPESKVHKEGSLTIRGFKEIKIVKDGDLSFTSMYQSNNDNSKWLIKGIREDNNKHWILHQFIASKIFAKFIGEEFVGKTQLVRAENGKILIATEALDNFTNYFDNKNMKAIFPLNCMHGGCIIDKNGKVKRSDKTKISTYNGKPIEGFEFSNLLSIFCYDEDTKYGDNFALIEQDNITRVVRFDFDASFKFFDYFSISKGYTRDIQNGYLRADAHHYYRQLDNEFRFYKKKNPQNILDAFGRFFDVPLADILSAVDSAFIELGRYYSDEDISQMYNIEQLNCKKYSQLSLDLISTYDRHEQFCEFDDNTKPLEKLKSYIKYFLTRSYDYMQGFYICTKVEVALHQNNITAINAMISNRELKGESIVCTQGFLNPDTPSQLTLLMGESDYLRYSTDPITFNKLQLEYGMLPLSIADFKLKNIPFRGVAKNDAFKLLQDYFAHPDNYGSVEESLLGDGADTFSVDES